MADHWEDRDGYGPSYRVQSANQGAVDALREAHRVAYLKFYDQNEDGRFVVKQIERALVSLGVTTRDLPTPEGD